ncbi:MAG: SpoIIIAH-like family protein [Clostridia bacterium]|nr:SpoIIIAH-like family protein [Clostridiales bacterium]MBQ6716481.1 SpoIIIAH-like family protein [Clostridia bacterium]
MKMEKLIESAGLTLAATVVLISMAASFFLEHTPTKQEEAVKASSAINVFEEFRQERERVRQLETVQLTALMNDEGADQDIRLEAYRMLAELTRFMEQEATMEGILKMRGHADCVVTVHESSVNVVIYEGSGGKNEAAFILDLALRETGQAAGNVKILEV